MIVLDAIALGTSALMLLAGGLGLFAPPRHRTQRGRHGRSDLVRSWSRR
jgi:hypothetical protein